MSVVIFNVFDVVFDVVSTLLKGSGGSQGVIWNPF